LRTATVQMAPRDATAETFSSRKVCLSRAREHLANRAYRSARQTLERGLRQWPDLAFDHEYLTQRGHAAWRLGRLKEATGVLRAACRDENGHVEARFTLGRVLLESGRLEEAARLMESILNNEEELVPYRVHAGGALSVAFASLGLNKSSQDALEYAAAFGLVSGQLLADEGYRLMRIGAMPEAEVQLAKGLQVDATCEDAFLRLANTLYIQNKLEPAMEVLAYGIEQSPEHAPFYLLMAELYTSRGQHKEAAAFLHRALEISPDADHADESRLTIIQALTRAERFPEAEAACQELLTLHPRSRLRREAQLRLEALRRRQDGARSARLAGFPRKLQKRAFCMPNTLANVLNFVGVHATQEDVAARVFRGDSTRWPETLDYLKGVDDIAWRGFLGTLERVKSCLDAGLPLITTEYHGSSGHALALIGYHDAGERLVAQDPRFLEPVEIPYAEFLRGWEHDDCLTVAVAPLKQATHLPEVPADEQGQAEEFVELLRLRAEQSAQARDLASRLSEAAPERQAPLRILAEIALEQRDASRLKEICEQALSRWPRSFWARRHLGDALWMDGDAEAALREYHRARRLDNRDPQLSYATAELLLSLGRTRSGRALLLRALREEPRLHHARLRLARDLAEAGEAEAAAFHAGLLVEFDPDHQQGRAFLEELQGKTKVRTLAEMVRRANEEAERKRAAAEQVMTRNTVSAETAPAAGDEDVEVDLEGL
jgi:tetratricopeptide (TPR) repeat protein